MVSSRTTVIAESLSVFISYSRKDTEFVDWLASQLEAKGLRAFVDRRDLPYGEKWQQQLTNYIADCDSVVFVTTAHSAKSKWCQWELTKTAEHSKRLIPIVRDTLAYESLPAQIAEVNLLPFFADKDPSLCLDDLVKAIEQDQDWMREHSRLGSLARAWEENQRNADRLLRGKALTAAERWVSKRPAGAPEPSRSHLAFISASQASAKTRSRKWITGSLVIAAITASLAAIAWNQRGEAIAQRNKAIDRLKEATSLRLMEDVKRYQTSGELFSNTGRVTRRMVLAAHSLMSSASLKTQGVVYAALQSQVSQHWDRTLSRQWHRELGHEITALSVNSEGTGIAIATDDNLIQSLDGKTGSRTGATFSGHTDTVLTVAHSPVGNKLASGSADRTVRVWDPAAPGQVSRVFKGHTDAVHQVAFDPNGRFVVSGSADRTVRLWDTQDSSDSSRALSGHEAAVTAVAFGPDGSWIVSGSEDGTLRLWSLPSATPEILLGVNTRAGTSSGSGPKADELAAPHPNAVRAIAISRNGSTLAVCCQSDKVLIWRIASGKPSGAPKEIRAGPWNEPGPIAISLSQTGDYLAAGTPTSQFMADLRSGETIGRALTQESMFTFAIHLNPDGKTVLAASKPGTVSALPVLEGWKDAICAKDAPGNEVNMTRTEWNDRVSDGLEYIRFCPDDKVR